MKKLVDREKLFRIAKEWEKQGIVVLAVCKKEKCKNQPLFYMTNGEDSIGYVCPACKKKWFWE